MVGRLRQVLLGGKPNIDSRFGVTLRRVNSDHPIFATFINPHRGKTLGDEPFNHYVVYIPWFAAFIKVDKRSWPGDGGIDEAVLGSKHPPMAFLQEPTKNKELNVMRKIVKKRSDAFHKYFS